MSRRARLAVLGLLPAVLGAVAGHAALAAEPARVTGASAALDSMEIGNQLGLNTAYGVASGVVFTPLGALPPEAAPVVGAVAEAMAVPPQHFPTAQAGGQQFIDTVRTAIAPLAAGNGQANAGIEALAGQLEATASQYGTLISPLDKTTNEVATTLRSVEE
jgi:hypothetical protein